MQKRKMFCVIIILLGMLFSSCKIADTSSTEHIPLSDSEQNSQQPFSSSTSDSSSFSDYNTPLELPFSDKGNWQKPYPLAMLRGWHASPVVGAGYANRYLFLSDGTFYFSADTMNLGIRLRYMDGTWVYDGNAIILTVVRKIVIEGGTFKDGEEARPYPNIIVGGNPVKYEMDSQNYETITLVLGIMDFDSIESPSAIGSILLDDSQFWGMASVGYTGMPTYWETYTYS